MDILSDVLTQMRLQGTLYFRTAFTSPWSVRVPPYESVARFHYAHKGRCFVRISPAEEPVDLNQGDLVIVNRGASHVLYCDPTTEGQAENLEDVIEKSGFTGKGTLVYGPTGSHHETQLICGHFAFDKRARHPLIDRLPAYIHIRNYGEIAGPWMEHTLKVIGSEAGGEQLGSEIISLKLSEIIFAQAIRSYLASDINLGPGLKGFIDPRIGAVLNAIHADPGRNWDLSQLSQVAALSRTSFALTFNRLMSQTPNSYITQWRMQLARSMLEQSNRSILDIAIEVGYGSEAAFGRVFKKHFNLAPATYRRQYQGEYDEISPGLA